MTDYDDDERDVGFDDDSFDPIDEHEEKGYGEDEGEWEDGPEDE